MEKQNAGVIIGKILGIIGIVALGGMAAMAIALMELFGWQSAEVYAFLPLTLAAVCVALVIVKPGKPRKITALVLAGVAACWAVGGGIHLGVHSYNESITLRDGNIDTALYLPFDPDSRIARLDRPASITMEDPLPSLDGATALFPLYSAFVNAVYPQHAAELNRQGGPFRFTNTVNGYDSLAMGELDIMFGAYPSQEQRDTADSHGNSFIYTPIGREGFVFFVRKDNPVDNLSIEQVKGIYSGEITNWQQVGGKDMPISAYQRNEGSGSQSTLVGLMGDTKLMEPPTNMLNNAMGGIIRQTASYRNDGSAIGFSFRYYAQDMVRDRGIKLLAIEGIEPTLENISSGEYPLTSEFYAVTTRRDAQIDKLLAWILSAEGQQIVRQTGYGGVN